MPNKRNVKLIVIHCTTTQPEATVESIKKYWKEVKGWKDILRYHYLVNSNGESIKLLDESLNSYGVYAHNRECINICYTLVIDRKGNPKDTRTRLQEVPMFNKVVKLTERYPNASVLGHRDFPNVSKACPSFDVKNCLPITSPGFNSICWINRPVSL